MEDLGLVDEMLADAYELVLEGWCQGAEAQDEFGQPVEPSSASARRWSASGALTACGREARTASGRRSRRSTANLALVAVVRDAPQAWNDAADRTQWQVLDAILSRRTR